MERQDESLHGLGRRELALLRATLMGVSARSHAELADLAGLSESRTVDAAATLSEIGLARRRPEDSDFVSLRPDFEHDLWPRIAARVAATPIRWPDVPAAPVRRDLARASIEKRTVWTRRDLGRYRDAGDLDDDARLAASLLWYGVSGFSEGHAWVPAMAQAVALLPRAAWWWAAQCFGKRSLRRKIGLSIADSRTLPGVPPMLVIDRSRTVCGVCNCAADWGEERHMSIMGDLPPRPPGCGVEWTHYTLRAWVAEVGGFVGRDGEMRKWQGQLRDFPVLAWLDP